MGSAVVFHCPMQERVCVYMCAFVCGGDMDEGKDTEREMMIKCTKRP